MLPHDEEFYLVHTGVKGMRWGIRKSAKEKASDYHVKAEKESYKADVFAKKAAIKRAKGKTASAKDYERASKKYADKRDLHRRKAEMYDNIAKRKSVKTDSQKVERINRAAKKSYDKPYRREDQRRHQSSFTRAVGSLAQKTAVNVLTTATLKVIGPTAEAFGESILSYTASKSARMAAGKAARSAFKVAAKKAAHSEEGDSLLPHDVELYLAHAGVKGMKWKQKKGKKNDQETARALNKDLAELANDMATLSDSRLIAKINGKAYPTLKRLTDPEIEKLASPELIKKIRALRESRVKNRGSAGNKVYRLPVK